MLEKLSFIDHPNIVKIYGIFEQDDKIYVVLEFCDETL
jgi:serine/threonine protein kinase